MLRAYIRHDRKLMADLSQAAHSAISKFMELAVSVSARSAMAVVKHTCGEGARFHPHLHVIAASGGWD